MQINLHTELPIYSWAKCNSLPLRDDSFVLNRVCVCLYNHIHTDWFVPPILSVWSVGLTLEAWALKPAWDISISNEDVCLPDVAAKQKTNYCCLTSCFWSHHKSLSINVYTCPRHPSVVALSTRHLLYYPWTCTTRTQGTQWWTGSKTALINTGLVWAFRLTVTEEPSSFPSQWVPLLVAYFSLLPPTNVFKLSFSRLKTNNLLLSTERSTPSSPTMDFETH